MKMASWSSVSEHLVNPIGMSDQLKWNNQIEIIKKQYKKEVFQFKLMVSFNKEDILYINFKY